jgi:transcriptional regulator with XRE-family HTH domain
MSREIPDEVAAGEAAAHPVDRHVGLRIRLRRKEIGLSQEKLGEALGITFQQVQKYERGANRISASKLWETARALRVPVAHFYEGLAEPDEPIASNLPLDAQDFLLTPEGLELAASFLKLPSGRIRRKFVELVRAVSAPDGDDGGSRIGYSAPPVRQLS